MKTDHDYDLAPYLSRGRQLRSQAFLSAFIAVRDWIKGAATPAPKPVRRAQNV